jgi:two-component system response regulator AtoC
MKVLIIDDDTELLERISRLFKLEHDVEPHVAENGLSAKRMLEQDTFDAVITDLDMPGLDGMGLLTWIQQEQPKLPVIMMSGIGDIPDAVDAMKIGAKDYVVKPVEPEKLLAKLGQLVTQRKLQEQIITGAQADVDFTDCIGESDAMRDIKALVHRIAPTPSTVLITGESGTGKEVIARMIHQYSPRAEKPFVAINIGGVPETLLESELFGHEKGAFTGAVSRKTGLFETATSGTLFLDEIGEMPLHLQIKLLRVLQEREIQPLGSTKSIPIDVRILTATNKQLEEQIRQGLFREDLYYRLNIIQIALPPLRDRRDDIPLLAGHFIKKCNERIGKMVQKIHPKALVALQRYTFPGNVRELENIIERAMVFAQTDTLTLHNLGMENADLRPAPKGGTLEELQKQAIVEALQRWEGNRTRAADELGINRKTLLNKIKEYGLIEN